MLRRIANLAAAVTRLRRFTFLPAVLSLMFALLGCSAKQSVYATDPELREVNMSNRTGGEIGGTLTVYGAPVSQRSADIRPFVRTGIAGDFSNERSGSLPTFGGGGAVGRTTASQSWTVPLMAGLSVPASSIGWNVPGLTAEVFAGAHVTRRKSSLFLTETAAPPGASPISASSNWTTFDPAVGAALMYQVGKVSGRPVTVGPSVTVDWTRSHEYSVQSPNFATETYIVTNRSRAETRLMLNLNVAVNSMVSAGATGGLTR